MVALICSPVILGPVDVVQAQVAVEPYLGVYWFDDNALDFPFQEVEFGAGPILGARVLYPLGEHWWIGGGYGYASYNVTFRIPTVIEPEGLVVEGDASEHLYYGTLEYAPLPPDPVGVHFLGELGGATYTPEDGESTRDLLAGFGAGLDLRAGERGTIRLDLRDHLRFCSQGAFAVPLGRVAGSQASKADVGGLCEEDQILHNLELSAGLRVRF